ncbi:hypothetical protein RAD16_05205 [Bradyrhizobium sp. 18BD]
MRKNRQERRQEAAQAGNSQLDPFKIYMNAERFRAADAILRSDANMKDYGPTIAAPSMVLSAFASELYLKCLFVIETGRSPPDTHDLRKLFTLLSDLVRNDIENSWDAYNSTPSRVSVFEAIERQTGRAVPRDLRWHLKAGGDGFTSLRYQHEERHQNVAFFLGDFHLMVRDAVLFKRPSWANLIHGPARPII